MANRFGSDAQVRRARAERETHGMTATLGPCISADSHVTEPPGTYIDRIDPKYRDRAPRLHHHDMLGDVMLIDNGKSLVPFWLVAAAGRPTEEVRLDIDKRFDDLWRGGWDPVARLLDQDLDGVVAEVIYPSVGMLLCNHPDAEYQRACFNAYNLWIAEFCATAPERLIGLGQTALVTPEDGIRDLEAIKKLGLKGVMLPGIPPQKDYDDPMYDELWDAIIDLGLPPSFHILTSRSDTPGADHVRVCGGGVGDLFRERDTPVQVAVGVRSSRPTAWVHRPDAVAGQTVCFILRRFFPWRNLGRSRS